MSEKKTSNIPVRDTTRSKRSDIFYPWGCCVVGEILALTGITIAETGEPGKGARFEMMVPAGQYRLANPVKE
jgi:hypothetical protein